MAAREAEEPDREQDSLQAVGPRDRPQPAQEFVAEDRGGEHQHAGRVGDGAVGEAGNDVSHRHELRQQVVRDGRRHQQVGDPRQPRIPEPVVKPVGRGHEAVALGGGAEAGSDHQIDDHDGQHEPDAHHPRESDPVGLPGVADQGVPAVLRRVEREKEHHPAEPAAGEIEIGERFRSPGGARPDAEEGQHRDVGGEGGDHRRSEPHVNSLW